MSSKVETIHKFEQAVVWFLNGEGWDLEWAGNEYSHYDAIGRTPNGNKCVIEMKFRKTYYEDKMLEVYKYDKLMQLDPDIVKLYFVADPKGNYLFWLNKIQLGGTQQMYCPKTTLWDSGKQKKDVYLIPESVATICNFYNLTDLDNM